MTRSGLQTVLAVHAHPDDECSKCPATMARLAAEGVRTVLVTCTDGAAGELSDPALLSGHDDLASLRQAELADAVALLGYQATHALGYADSGMEGSRAGSFATLPLRGIAEQILSVIEQERPEVVITYDPEYAAGHPDHLRSYEATVEAFRIALDNGLGVRKLYGTRTHSPAKVAAMNEWLVAQGLESPYGSAIDVPGAITTRVEVGEFIGVSRAALRCHRSQVAPDDRWFFAVPDEVMQVIFPWEEFRLLSPSGAFRPGEFEGDPF